MAPTGGSGLTVRVGTDLATLADDLGARLASPVLGVLEREVVVVPTPGIARWLEARLSRVLGAGGASDGICANVDFLLLGELLGRVSGLTDRRDDPWSIGRMTVASMAAMLEATRGDEIDVLRRDDDRAGVFAGARAHADLFDQLFRWRPDVADEWLDGHTDDPRAALLRRLATGTSTPAPHRALDAAAHRLAGGDDVGLDLPERLFLFGGDSLPGGPQFPRVLGSLGTVRDVALYLVCPSLDRFDAIASATPPWEGRAPERGRDDRVDADHPLLTSWGTTSADTAALIAQLGDTTSTERVIARAGDGRSLLSALRRAIAAGDAPPSPADGSVSLHGCVGARRQVEVARDAVLHALADDETLEPSDVVVLCADLPRFARHLEAVLGDPQGAPSLPYVLRDRTVSRTVPLVASMEAALRLIVGRVPRSAVVDLLRSAPIARRFGLDAEDVDRIAEWSATTDVRWGLDGADRGDAGLPASFDAGTWRRGLDRLLAGAALPDGHVSDVVGLRAVSPGHDLERVGAFGDVIDALATLRAETASPRAIPEWCDFVVDVLAALFATSGEDAAVEQLQLLLIGLSDDARGVDAAIPFSEFRELFADRASQVRDLVVTGFGGVTVTSLAPLRNVPFRVVVLLGLDERSLSRSIAADHALGAPRVGDHDERADVRASLLGAVLSCSSRLIATYDAADLVTNEAVPPTSALAELREAIDQVCTDRVDDVTWTHPRHAHGEVDLAAGPPRPMRPYSFDRGALRRAIELRGAAASAVAGARLDALDAPPPSVVDTATLVGFLRAPQRTFLADSLGVRVPYPTASTSDELSTDLDDLERWRATGALVHDALGVLPRDVDDVEWARFAEHWARQPDGVLWSLPGCLADRSLEGDKGISVRGRDLMAKVAGARGDGPGERVRAEVKLDSGDTVRGEPEVFGGTTIVHWTASTHDRRIRVAAIVDLLVLTAWQPETSWRVLRVWRGGSRAASQPLSVDGPTAAHREAIARRALGTLVDLWRRGRAEPLPLFPNVTMRMLDVVGREDTPSPRDLLAGGVEGWSTWGGRGDGEDPAVRFCFDASYDELGELPVRPDDPTVSRPTGGSRLLTYSLAMLEGLLALEHPATAQGTR